ncbi:UdgX family uracil-DNA binding protein [Novosphingobium resinovorum]|uniref:UdgX family uracil-DNA binding protein n=1 Tax=Novosphingobium TaxID=165696 RepID=UPI001B3C554B|nr:MULTISPECIES: UdgX family uracil-DNA binding protein [Novosphingobium]MBF7011739.1 UdgX family uracil-DNA binding protein [Novosphingobium sp. HR1a]WJM26491.1 UdgX family uracil-DNA binding protein [Novosphingobium resinovorum]
MIAAAIGQPDDFEAWRDEARRLVARGIAPEATAWGDADGSADLFAAPSSPQSAEPLRQVRASRAFLDLAGSVVLHCDAARLGLLYRVLWRLQDRPRLLEDAADRDVAALERMAKQVRRDIHKMRAFVRFRSVADEDGIERFVAWFEPEHRIERANADFFVNRFASQRWSILTPRLSLHWNGEVLLEGPPASRADAPAEDATEDLWLGYYRSIFNPARLKVGMMLKEMPRRYWKNLPEARQIPDLIAGAHKREAAMIASGADLFQQEAAPFSLQAIAEGIAQCRRCPIGCNGTRAVMGEGPQTADLMIVGEQPGDTEERENRPFIGPAGQLLDRALGEAGVDRTAAYVTNAVKHFKFAPRGKRRLHQAPTAGEIDMCRWWLDNERALVKPKVVLALGASSARGLLGRTPAIGRERGRALYLPDGTRVWLTAHPSYLLRLDGESREREQGRFAEDLAGLAQLLAASGVG